MARMLLAAVGTGGDVDPVVGLGKALHRRGHAVTVMANGFFEGLVRSADLDFAPLGTAEEYLELQKAPDAWDAERAFPFALRKLFLPQLQPLYRLIAERFEPGRTAVAAHLLAVGARVAQEKLGVPLASLVLQPCLLEHPHEPSGPSPVSPDKLSVLYRRFTAWAKEYWLMDAYLGNELERFRHELGLPSVRHHFWHWSRSPQRVLGLFPDWFAPPPRDWSASLRLTGFPLYDEADREPMLAEATEFLDAGEPPIVFTFGTAMRQAGEIFAESVAACRLLGRRGLLLTRYPEQVPDHLPDGITHFAYLPFGQVLPRAAALVHHGGIGTLSQALRAGIPQVVVPFAFDQPDNANRLQRLGVAVQVSPSEYRAAAVTKALQEVLASGDIGARCRAYADKVRSTQGLADGARAIEALV